MGRKILLVTTVKWPSAARYAAGFVAAGCTVDALAPSRAPITASRYLSQHYLYETFTPVASLRLAVEQSDCDLLVALDDRAVAIMMKYARAGDGYGLVAHSLGRIDRFDTMLSRHASLMAMREAGVRVPDTFAIGGEGELEQALGETGFPAVLKSDGSWGGEGVAIVRDRAAAITAYRRLSEPPSRLRCLARAARRRDTHFVIEAWAPLSRTMSLQRFIPGTPAASAFAAWRGTVTGSICYDVLVADGDIGPPSVIRRVDDREMEFASAAAAERFGLSGLHGLDFIRDADGQVHLLEINPRATLGGTLAFGRGRDLPACLAAAAFGSASGMRPAIVNDTVVMFPREWQRSPSSEWIRSGHHDVPWDDPDVFRAALGAPVARRRA